MTLTISHKGLEFTPAIKDYVEEKMTSLTKYLDSIEMLDVEIGRVAGHQRKGEVYECKAVVKIGRKVMKVEREARDLYKAINKVRDHLRVELSDLRKKFKDRSHGGSTI